jgi:hypothetical protein
VLEANLQQVAFANAALIWHATRQIYAWDEKFFYQRYDGELRRGSDLVKVLQQQVGASVGDRQRN